MLALPMCLCLCSEVPAAAAADSTQMTQPAGNSPSCLPIRRASYEPSEGDRLPREGVDLWGGPVTSGELRELLRKSGKLPGNLLYNALLFYPQRDKFRGSRRGTSGEVRGHCGKSREFPEAFGEVWLTPGSDQATRRNCLQI